MTKNWTWILMLLTMTDNRFDNTNKKDEKSDWVCVWMHDSMKTLCQPLQHLSHSCSLVKETDWNRKRDRESLRGRETLCGYLIHRYVYTHIALQQKTTTGRIVSCTHTHTSTNTRAHAHTNTHTHTHTHTHTQAKMTTWHITSTDKCHTATYPHTKNLKSRCSYHAYVHTYVKIYIHMYIYTYVYVFICSTDKYHTVTYSSAKNLEGRYVCHYV